MKDDHGSLRMTTQWLWDNMQGNKEEGESEWCGVVGGIPYQWMVAMVTEKRECSNDDDNFYCGRYCSRIQSRRSLKWQIEVGFGITFRRLHSDIEFAKGSTKCHLRRRSG